MEIRNWNLKCYNSAKMMTHSGQDTGEQNPKHTECYNDDNILL